MTRRRAVTVLVGLSLLLPASASTVVAGSSIIVDTFADNVADDGHCTLREAIVAANTDTASGATAGECAAGSGIDAITFTMGGTLTLTAALPGIDSDLSIDGAEVVSVDGADAFAPFTIVSGIVTLAGLTITAGVGAGVPSEGGAIRNAGALTVKDSTISDNYAVFGSGIRNAGTLTIIGSTVSLNVSDDAFGMGGGVFGGDITVTDSTMSGNSSGGCGGIGGQEIAIIDSTISHNHAETQAGGVCADSATVTGSTISGNEVDEGTGGILAVTVMLVDSTVTQNRGGQGGGGIAGEQVTAANSTIAGNADPLAG